MQLGNARAGSVDTVERSKHSSHAVSISPANTTNSAESPGTVTHSPMITDLPTLHSTSLNARVSQMSAQVMERERNSFQGCESVAAQKIGVTFGRFMEEEGVF